MGCQAVENYLGRKYYISTAGTPPPGLIWQTIPPLPEDITNVASYTDSNLTANTNYWYRCVAEGPSGTVTGPAMHVITLSGQAPGVPNAPVFTNVTTTGVTVTAPALPANAQAMKLQRKLKDDPEGAYVDVQGGLAAGAVTNVSGLLDETEYTFRYVAIGDSGSTPGISANVTMGMIAPEVPGTPQFSNVLANSLTTTMPDLPARATSLTLQIRTAPDTYVNVTNATNLKGGAVLQVTGLTASTAYSFRCVAVGPGGSTNGLAAGVTTGTPAPGAPGAPVFSELWTTSVRVTAPALPTNATSLRLQGKLASQPVAAYTTIVMGVLAGAKTDVSGLTTGAAYDFRYVAVGDGGVTAGAAATVTTLSPTISWQPGSRIECLGIRWPLPGATLVGGAEGKLSSFLATDFDYRDVSIGGQTRSAKFTDPCTYTWTASGGAFKNGVATGQSVVWIAPSAPGTYTLTLTVDDQGSANISAGQGGSRNDSARSFNDDSLRFSVQVTVP